MVKAIHSRFILCITLESATCSGVTVRLSRGPATYRKVAEQRTHRLPDVIRRSGRIVTVPGPLLQALHQFHRASWWKMPCAADLVTLCHGGKVRKKEGRGYWAKILFFISKRLYLFLWSSNLEKPKSMWYSNLITIDFDNCRITLIGKLPHVF